jgi:hypothetical protein
MRHILVRARAKKGVAEGSWVFAGSEPGTSRGGRLYGTSTPILEVYYRHRRIFEAGEPGDVS